MSQLLIELQALEHYIRHVQQAIATAPDEYTRMLRVWVLALAEAEAVRMRRELDMNNIGQLCYRDGKSLLDTITEANQAFQRNPNLTGLTPAEIHVNPLHVADLPPKIEVDFKSRQLAVPVVADKTIQPNYIWLCSPEQEKEYA